LFAAALADSLRAQKPSGIRLDRPDYALLRQDEDWSAFRARPAFGDPWDPIKHMVLDEELGVTLSVGGSGRLRWDRQRNLTFGGADDDSRALWRALLHGDLGLTRFARVFVEIEHAGTTDGDLPGGRRPQDVEGLDLQQGFGDLRFEGHDDGVVLRVGRQAFALGAERLVSPFAWSNTLRRWDGFTVRAGALRDIRATGFWTQHVPGDPHTFNDADAGEQFFGAYLESRGGTDGHDGLDAYYLARMRDRVTVAGTSGGEERHTLGARIAHAPEDGAVWDLEAAWQFGRVGPGAIAAWFAAGEFGYVGGDAWSRPRVYAGFELASGDDSAGGDVETFDPLYPDSHRHLGLVDAVGQSNIAAVWLGHELEPFDAWALDGRVLSFWRMDDSDGLYGANGQLARAATPGAGRHVGIELDLSARFALDRHGDVRLGWGRLWSGDFLSDSGSARDRQRFFAEVEYTF